MAVESFPLLGRYREAELIGVGGIGEVYRATDSLLGRLVALKVMGRGLAADVVVRRRFMREARGGATVRIPARRHGVRRR
jgi:serine/threonine-protein kinase